VGARAIAAPVIVAVALGACSEPEPQWSAAERKTLASLTQFGAPVPSPGNPYADEAEAALFGRSLFFDDRLGEGGVSCATCHVPERSYTDGRPVALGISAGLRNTPTLLGAAWLRYFGWEGAADSVWAQALLALEAPSEHAASEEGVLRRVQSAHRATYERVFGEPPQDAKRVWVRVAQAIEAYVRTLRVGPAPFDQYVGAVLAGDASGGGHLSPPAVRGLAAFLRQGCVDCHHGPWLSDGEFHNLGLPPSAGTFDQDPGRQRGVERVRSSPHRCKKCPETEYLDANFAGFVGAFKTPTLRNVARTAPFMHTGQFRTLEEVIEFYRKLPGTAPIGERDPRLRPLARSVSTRELVAFLRALTGPEWEQISAETRARPARSEQSRSGTSGATPEPSRR
jgi:cytochrome c peroxidase